jgi:hypothetical protein
VAKAYRREKIVKAIKKIKRDHEVRIKLFVDANRTQTIESLIKFQNKVFETIIEDLCNEFDIKEEEIT